ncbi:MAG: NAD(P)-dependent oxidoreductase [Candidatus Rokubacteria bacterium]|nr:NAD(P)-dependent oxidoreductase [Candidatus Rokubacteria bacterium]
MATAQAPAPVERMRWWQSDLADLAAVRRLLDETGAEVVYHLAGAVSGAPDLELVPPTLASQLVTAVHLLQAVTERRCHRLVLAASLEEPRGRAERATPTSPYGAAKAAAGAYARMFHALYGTPVVVLRPFMTYGPRQPERRLVSHVIGAFLKGEAPALTSGRRRMDWVYLDDVIDGFLGAALRPGIDGLGIDLGSGRAISIRKVVRTIAALMGTSIRPAWGALPDRPAGPARVADVAAARAALGWTPVTALEDGLARTVDWYRKWEARTQP